MQTQIESYHHHPVINEIFASEIKYNEQLTQFLQEVETSQEFKEDEFLWGLKEKIVYFKGVSDAFLVNIGQIDLGSEQYELKKDYLSQERESIMKMFFKELNAYFTAYMKYATTYTGPVHKHFLDTVSAPLQRSMRYEILLKEAVKTQGLAPHQSAEIDQQLQLIHAELTKANTKPYQFGDLTRSAFKTVGKYGIFAVGVAAASLRVPEAVGTYQVGDITRAFVKKIRSSSFSSKETQDEQLQKFEEILKSWTFDDEGCELVGEDEHLKAVMN